MHRKALTSDSLSTTTFSSIRNFPSPPLPSKSRLPCLRLAARVRKREASMVVRREVNEEDGVPSIQAQADGCQGQLEQQCTFELKGAE